MHADTLSRPQQLDFSDARDLADLKNFVTRAKSIQDSGLRLQAAGPVLLASVCVLRPAVLGEATPTVLGLRTIALNTPAELDVTVPLSAVLDRVARDPEASRLEIPPATVRESWAGIGVPRGPWEPVASIDPSALRAAAEEGIARVAGVLPDSPGALIVNNARAAVWGETFDGGWTLEPGDTGESARELPLGAAFAAHALGFLRESPLRAGEPARLFRHGTWWRLSTAVGHVLVRRAARLGG
ncbi:MULTISPECIES: hypothetical protein [Arthrobacter]|uniref:Uncharacterized protein n=2 Tax=Arthrobacter TaxID=1663 RepID=A0ABU9KFH7_9MICC|nr:hypothetical protein [Arthrobacter sp. YJM1]MDP5225641.1 hypothetical protein [Arthrobacter sp. YJM1]